MHKVTIDGIRDCDLELTRARDLSQLSCDSTAVKAA